MSGTPVEIPLSGQNQTFPIVLGPVTYTLTFTWRDAMQTWCLDIADQYGNLIIGGIPLVTGVDLLGQYAYLGFAGALVVQTDNAPDVMPTFDNLGTTSHLYWIPD
jgi:predicted Zn-dependent protease with MMP-like domain